jgi:hypothetical protein
MVSETLVPAFASRARLQSKLNQPAYGLGAGRSINLLFGPTVHRGAYFGRESHSANRMGAPLLFGTAYGVFVYGN